MERRRTILAAVLGVGASVLLAGGARGQLVLDGSLLPPDVPADPITLAPDASGVYQIDDSVGRFSDADHHENRYHSFSRFDLATTRTALFSSSYDVARVIVRVTGGSASQINGKLKSAIPGADLYFLNPFGIAFNSGASIEVTGSFHASSADVLRFPSTSADLATGSLARPAVLSVAEPASFGFTPQHPEPSAAIRVSTSSRPLWDSTQAQTPSEGRTLSLVAGELIFQSFNAPNVRAPGVTVQLAAVAGPSNVPLALEDLDAGALPAPPADCTFGGAGCMTLFSGSALDVSSLAGGAATAGRIVIRGGRFEMLGGNLIAFERGAAGGEPGLIDIGVNGAIGISDGSVVSSVSESSASGPDIHLSAPRIEIDGGRVGSEVRSAGAGGAIAIESRDGTLRISNASARFEGSSISTNTIAGSTGAGGDLTVDAADVQLVDGGQLLAETNGAGVAGRLAVLAADTVHLSGADVFERPSGFTSRASETATTTARSGDIAVDARILEVENGAQISAATAGAGAAGDVELAASESVTIRGGEKGFSLVSAASRQPSGQTSVSLGQSGDLTIEAPRVTLADGGQASVSTEGTLDAGELEIVADDVSISGVVPDPEHENPSGVFAQQNSASGGAAGDITITSTRNIEIADHGIVSALTKGSGSGGSLALAAGGGVTVIDGGAISAQSIATGDAGDIKIDAGPRLEIVRASVTTEARNASGGRVEIAARDAVVLQDANITTSVRDGTGGGGDVTIDPEFVILDRSAIRANADEGPGGNIQIRADTFLASPDSVLDASSELGIDGNVVIDSPNPELTGKIAALPQGFLNASALLADPCLARTATEGSFVVRQRSIRRPPDAALTPESGEPLACSPR